MVTKTETRQKDIDAKNEMTRLSKQYSISKRALEFAIERTISSDTAAPVAAFEAMVDAGRKSKTATLAFQKIPKDRQQWVCDASNACVSLGMKIDAILPRISGQASVKVLLGKHVSVSCTTSKGEKYSNSCKYSKTDGDVKLTINADAVIGLMDSRNSDVISGSFTDGLPVISVNKVSNDVWACRWVQKSRGYSIKIVSGWIAMGGGVCFHSTKSPEHASAGLKRKNGGDVGDLTESKVITRRMIQNATGWCGPGIQAWIDKYMPEHSRKKSVSREIVIEAANRDTGPYGKRIVSLLVK